MADYSGTTSPRYLDGNSNVWIYVAWSTTRLSSGGGWTVILDLYLQRTSGYTSYGNGETSLTCDGQDSYTSQYLEATGTAKKVMSRSFTVRQNASSNVSKSCNAWLSIYDVCWGNQTFNVTCKRNYYSISYNANGGTGAPSKQWYQYKTGTSTYISNTQPTRSGYKFLGWSINKNATTASYKPGQGWAGTNQSDYVLYAVWQKEVYTITFDALDGTIYPDGESSVSKQYSYEEQLGELPIAQRPNYKFIGWNNKADGSGGWVYEDTQVLGNRTFYAQYELQANCYYKQDGVYKTGMMYIRKEGTYKTGTVYVKRNGKYKPTNM